VLRKGGEVDRLPSTGIPLGLDSHAEFVTPPSSRLATGDLLLLLTDGIVEAMSSDGELFGTARTLEACYGHARSTLETILRDLLKLADDFSCGRVNDDRTVVLARVQP